MPVEDAERPSRPQHLRFRPLSDREVHAVQDDELWITRNEHYTDDVNSLALESILYQLIEDISGNKGDKMVIEG